ncbi:response regulator transcription factor [Cryptosporangium aurantiacum]|uniref:Two component transcriptional regulator, LuxR family n=1 Tax=Cryptosporangium aurantiacum TaxID=134849 RepID=A0A1M7RCD5_9ACTN|nr:response regulator transcription factor [Cryptosporangium aurantiacum]SHN43718.1 two component transcriptional regulator, LuxR family [Cryptosporangium aurantiacum]
MSVRIVLVDDQDLVRAGLRALLTHDPDLAVVGEASDGASGVTLVRRLRPDVVLMDVRMPGVDGVEATTRITSDENLTGTKVVMLTTFDTDEHLFDALRAGASGFLLKDIRPGPLRDAVRTVAAGEALLAPSVTRRVIEAAAAGAPPGTDTRLEALTGREREVLAEVGTGRSNDEVAATLYLSPATVRTYVSRLLAKLDARDRAQLVVLAYETGLVRRSQPRSRT